MLNFAGASVSRAAPKLPLYKPCRKDVMQARPYLDENRKQQSETGRLYEGAVTGLRETRRRACARDAART